MRVIDQASLALEVGAGHDHLVEFYETETFLIGTVCAFLGPALRDGDAAIVIATEAHRCRFDGALRAAGVDVDAAVSEGRYLALDAEAQLSGFLVDRAPDGQRFRDTVGAIVDRASTGGRKVRAYGEMVALLWDDGAVAGAIALEDMWNDLAESRSFALLCAYPTTAFADEATGAAFKLICEQHTTVIPSESYSLLSDPADRLREVAQLQQEAVALRSEVERQRKAISHDDLTGALRRRPGLVELDWEIAEARRQQRPLVLGFVDVDGLKAVNDRRGHAAGDRVLRNVATTLMSELRARDLVIRYGGDEFLCVLPGAHLAAATKPFARVNTVLAAAPEPSSVTVGLAELEPDESAADLVARADAALYRERHRQRSTLRRILTI